MSGRTSGIDTIIKKRQALLQHDKVDKQKSLGGSKLAVAREKNIEKFTEL